MNPIVGISTSFDMEEGNYYIRDYYTVALANAGAAPIIIPPIDQEGIIREYLNICDGLLLSGGGDIDPEHWGELPGWNLEGINPDRDRFELNLTRQAIIMQLPVLGICRGCQIINVASGGSLMQNIDSEMCHEQNAPRDYPYHSISIVPGSYLGQVVGINSMRVNSFHHQAISAAGQGLRISAWAADGVAEAIEGLSPGFVVGVQWHPECMQDKASQSIFEAFVRAAKEFATGGR